MSPVSSPRQENPPPLPVPHSGASALCQEVPKKTKTHIIYVGHHNGKIHKIPSKFKIWKLCKKIAILAEARSMLLEL